MQKNRVIHCILLGALILSACGSDEQLTPSLAPTDLNSAESDADLAALEEALSSFEAHFNAQTGATPNIGNDVSDVLPDDIAETPADPGTEELPTSDPTEAATPDAATALTDMPAPEFSAPDTTGAGEETYTEEEQPSKVKAIWDGFKNLVGGLIGRLRAPKEEEAEVPELNPSDQTNTYPKRPVIFVPGFMEADPSIFFFGMRNHLKAQGWTQIYYLKNGLVLDNAEKYAQRVKDKVDAVLAETGADKVDIVAHSFGGLYTRYYLKHLGGLDKVEHFISISSPHQGTKTSALGPIFPSAKQMMPESEFLSQLNFGDPSPGNVCYATLRTNTDIIIQPYDSSILEGANNHFVRNKNHFTILFSSETYQILQDTLSNPCDCCRAHG